MDVVLEATNEVLEPRDGRAVLRATPVGRGLKCFGALCLKGWVCNLGGVAFCVRVAQRQAAGVVAVTEAAPVFVISWLEVAVAQFQFVTAGQVPVVVAFDDKLQRPLGDGATGFGLAWPSL